MRPNPQGLLRSSILIASLLGAIPLAAETQAYRITPAPESRFVLEVEKTGLMSGKKHVFVFEQYNGRVNYDAQNPEQSEVELSIKSASLVAKDDWVSAKDLKKIEEEALVNKLAAAKYPEMKFRSRAVRTGGGAGKFEVEGDLTIRDLSRPVVVSVTLQPGSAGLVFDGSAVVKMKDYDMKPPTAAMGLIGTKNEMLLQFHLISAPAK